jgi:hypothetical protein
MTMAKKRRPGVGAPGPAETAAGTNDSSHSSQIQPQRKAPYGSNGAYALSYAKKRGWHVFPAPTGEKKSHKSAKHSDGRNWGATTDEKEITRDFKRWPKANVGVTTGPDSKIFVVEADTIEGHGVDGIASLEALQQENGELPQTLTAESPSGSIHHYFNYPADVEIRCSTSKIAEGVDVKGAGGMVIAPPSRKPNGRQYRWLFDYPIADAPAWLIKLCAAGSDGKEAPDKPAEELLADDLDKLAYAVGVIPNDLPGYKEWKNFGMAIFAATGGSDFGFSLFDGFSKRWTSERGKYDESSVQKAWEQISSSPPKRIGADWIYDKAGTAAPGWRTGYEEMRANTGTAEEKAKVEEERAKAKAREDELLDNLAKLDGLEYARKRKEAQEDLHVSARDIDNEVKARREAAAAPLYGHWIVEPWPEPVDGDSLLRDIIKRIKGHVVLSDNSALVIGLWLMMSWVHDAIATHSPILNITSAEPASGKTTTVNVCSFLMPKCITSVETTEAALFRSIQRWQPSFCFDEFDSVMRNDNKESLRSIINSGHTRGSGVVRCVGDDKVPEPFSTFAPKMLGMNGKKLPAPTLSRCIHIELRRRKRSEPVVKFKHRDDEGLATLRQRLARWAMDNEDTLRDAKPAMPEELLNRSDDNWNLLFAIADLCDGVEGYGERARAAALEIEGKADSRTLKTRLLADVKAIYDEKAKERTSGLFSETIVSELNKDEEKPWQTLSRGKELNQNRLADMLADFGIRSGTIRIDQTKKGYYRWQFDEAWERYL